MAAGFVALNDTFGTVFDASRAEGLGFRAEKTFDEIIAAHVEDELDGRVALVTGGSRGIGAAVAARLAERGLRCIAPTWPLGAHPEPLRPGADRSIHGVARIVADHMSKTLGQQLVIENVVGAGGTTGRAAAGAASATVSASTIPVAAVILVGLFMVFPFRIQRRRRWINNSDGSRGNGRERNSQAEHIRISA